LDNDAVLLGELAFAPFDRTIFLGMDLPHSLVVMGQVLILNWLMVRLFFKELKLATFDAGLAAALGFSPVLIHYALMGLVSVTAVGAFEAVGSILLVGLMVAPPATAYLLTDKLERMLGLSVIIGAGSAVGGYWLARSLDANIAGSITTVIGIVFVLTFLLAPRRGVLAIWRRRERQRYDFAQTMLTIHLFSHEGSPDYAYESQVMHLQEHLRWDQEFASEVVHRAQAAQWVQRDNGNLNLTEAGREQARAAIEY
jgi:manganese/zinc/iron transport system permease protein